MILPSSIHEMILIPCHDCEYDIESCSEIVKLVNENEVELTEHILLKYNLTYVPREHKWK